jgi:hypothetical protein
MKGTTENILITWRQNNWSLLNDDWVIEEIRGGKLKVCEN